MQWIIDPNKKLVLVINMPHAMVKCMALVDILLLNYKKKELISIIVIIIVEKVGPCSFSGHWMMIFRWRQFDILLWSSKVDQKFYRVDDKNWPS